MSKAILAMIAAVLFGGWSLLSFYQAWKNLILRHWSRISFDELAINLSAFWRGRAYPRLARQAINGSSQELRRRGWIALARAFVAAGLAAYWYAVFLGRIGN